MSTNPKWSDFLTGDPARVLAAANGLLPAWVSLIIVVLIGWQVAQVFWSLMPGPSTGDPVVAATQQASLRSGSAVDVASIAAASIFGKADVSDEPGAVQDIPAEIEETNLRNLALRGTIASDKAEFSIAIIADGSNDEKVYVIGDSVASGASLHAVYADRVVLNEGGALTSLSLPREFSAQAAPVQRSRPVRRTQANRSQSIQSVVSQNVTRLADVIRPTPYFVNGQQQGYRVYPGRDRQQFSSLGLRPGDLIKEIDGQSLTDPTQAMQIFQSLGTASQVSVTVERNGTPETLVLNTEQLDMGEDRTK